MNLQNEHSSRNLRLRWHISANALQLKALKLAPRSSLRWDQYCQLEHERALLEAELKLQGEIDLLHKYDPDQPREPAGVPEGGQWTDAAGASAGMGAAAAGTHARGSQSSIPALRNPASTQRLSAGDVRGIATLSAIVPRIRWNDDVGSQVEEYNELSVEVGDDARLVPIIASRAQAFTKGKDDAKAWAAVAALSREEAAKYCPNFLRVQTMLNEAAREAGPVSNFGSMALRGTAIHSLLKQKVQDVGSPHLRAEVSALKSLDGSLADRIHESDSDPSKWAKYAAKGTIRVDVYDRASEKLVCVYDPKTGKRDITVPRLGEIGRTVARYFGEGIQFFVMGMKPFE